MTWNLVPSYPFLNPIHVSKTQWLLPEPWVGAGLVSKTMTARAIACGAKKNGNNYAGIAACGGQLWCAPLHAADALVFGGVWTLALRHNRVSLYELPFDGDRTLSVWAT